MPQSSRASQSPFSRLTSRIFSGKRGQASSNVVEQDNPLSLGLEVVAEGKDPAVE
jgi:hypothetical protein